MIRLLQLLLYFILSIQLVCAQNLSSSTPKKKGLLSFLPQKKENIRLAKSILGDCELNFVNLVNGKLPRSLQQQSLYNIFGEQFSAFDFMESFKKIPANKRLDAFEELSNFINNEEMYMNNLADFVTLAYDDGMITVAQIKKLFVNKKFSNVKFFWSTARKRLYTQIDVSREKLELIDDFIVNQELSPSYAREYKNLLLYSRFEAEELKIAIENGLTLHSTEKHLEQLRDYIDFLYIAKPRMVTKGLERIAHIYDFNFQHTWKTLDPILTVDKQFLAQKSRLNVIRERHFNETLTRLKIQENAEIKEALIKLDEKRLNGLKISDDEYNYWLRRAEQVKVSPRLISRASRIATGKTAFRKKMLNGCNSGKSALLETGSRKYKKFKYSLGLGMGVGFYAAVNAPKYLDGEIDYYFEKIGFEIGITLAFTFVANKLVTNPDTTFMKKWFLGYLQFGAMDYILNGVGYNALFGSREHIRYVVATSQVIKQLLNGEKVKFELPEREIDAKVDEILNSPDKLQAYNDLLAYLEKQYERKNFRMKVNQLASLLYPPRESTMDKNLKKFKDVDLTSDNFDSPELREVLTDMVIEQIYYEGLTEHPWAFMTQTGSKGEDRFMFYRYRNTLWDAKSMSVSLMTFQILCRMPFGKKGSYAAATLMTIADQLVSNSFTYPYREKIINQ